MKDLLKIYESARKMMFRALEKEESGDTAAEDLFSRAKEQFSCFLTASALARGAYNELVHNQILWNEPLFALIFKFTAGN